ncbi:MAG: hypothetical protein ACYCO0_01415 [Candidatus Micrarchaeaceae archaeon]
MTATIHKSQGKGHNRFRKGTFAHGQLYVAHSRCTTLEGIAIKKKLQMRNIITDRRIAEFHKAHFK